MFESIMVVVKYIGIPCLVAVVAAELITYFSKDDK